MAESIMTYMAEQAGVKDQFLISSAGTSREEIGNSPHYGTVSKLREVGIPLIPHRAVQMTKKDYEKYDYLIGMDDANIRSMKRICGQKGDKMYKILEFADSQESVADPWYSGNFDRTYEDLIRGCKAFFDYLEKNGEIHLR